MSRQSTSFDLIVIGAGPAGRRAALQAAELGKRVALIEKAGALGGGSLTGTLPSKILRASILALTGRASVNGSSAREITIDDLLWRTQQVVEHQHDAIADELRQDGVRVFEGAASFVGARTLEIESASGSFRATAKTIVIAVGTSPTRPPEIDFDDRIVIDAEGIPNLAELPKALTVVGGGPTGVEYASMAAALGVHVTLVEQQPRILDFVDDEVVDALGYHLSGLGVAFRLGDSAVTVHRSAGRAVTRLASGTELASDAVLFAAGRRGATGSLNLAAAGLSATTNGHITVDAYFRTARRHILAAGDVTGSSGLASVAGEQGRVAALAACDEPADSRGASVPHAIYTIPEISFVGPTERQLTAHSVPFAVGTAAYRGLARAELAGDRTGFLKLLVGAATRRVLAVHIFGAAAGELVHIGQLAIEAGLTVDHLANAVFNVPSYSDAYRVAARDAARRLGTIRRRSAPLAA